MKLNTEINSYKITLKRWFTILVLFFGLHTFAQNVENEAKHLKKVNDELWYADKSFKNATEEAIETTAAGTKRNKTPDLSFITDIAKFLGIIALLGLIYAIFKSWPSKRALKPISIEVHDDLEDSIETTDDLYRIDFRKKIEVAEKNQNFRLAIRYYYLWILQTLSKGGYIQYDKNKTNRQYSEELKNSKKLNDFNTSTSYYNFTWYGEYLVTEDVYYNKVVAQFKTLLTI